MNNILKVKNLSVEFNYFKALTDVSLSIREKELRVIIGPNGAGKTTLMDIITGKTKPTGGQILFDGVNITGKSASEISGKYQIGRKFQGPNVFDNMTVEKNIEVALEGFNGTLKSFFFRRTAGINGKIDKILQQISLADKREVVASDLSHGERQWLEIGMIIAQKPKLIILDEPTAGMTAEETHKTGEMIKTLLKDQTVIVVEHDMDFVKQVAETVTVLHQGMLLAEGSFQEVQKDPRVIEVYLKESDE